MNYDDRRRRIATYLAYGSRLDAFAAAVSARLADAAPDAGIAGRLRENQADEVRHTAMQAEASRALMPELTFPNSLYIEAVGRMALTPDTLWNAVFLNVVEWRGFHQYRVAARRCRALGFAGAADVFRDISGDEMKHVKTGWENIKSLGGATPETIRTAARVIDALDRADHVVWRDIPEALDIPDLALATRRVEADLLEMQLHGSV